LQHSARRDGSVRGLRNPPLAGARRRDAEAGARISRRESASALLVLLDRLHHTSIATRSRDHGTVTPGGHALPPYPGFWHSAGLALICSCGIGHRFLYSWSEVGPNLSELGSCRWSW